MRNVILSALGSAAILLGWALPAAAQNLVLNPSFESPVMGNPGVLQDSIPAWTGTVAGVNNFGAFQNTAQIVAKDGANVAFINLDVGAAQGLVQSLGAVAVGERYDASAWFGWRADNLNHANVALELWIGGVVTGGDIAGGTKVASMAPTMIQGGWAPGAVSYTVPLADAGKTLRVRLAAMSPLGSQVNFDQVSVTKAVPTPVPTLSQWALTLLGVTLASGAALISHRRWTI